MAENKVECLVKFLLINKLGPAYRQILVPAYVRSDTFLKFLLIISPLSRVKKELTTGVSASYDR